jgi:RNA polymerase sigma-70 factor, ECF subfamily
VDPDLVVRAQGGDESAFALIANESVDRFLRVAHRILRDAQSAEDATQQALLNMWRFLPDLRDPARFEAWSYRLLVKACYSENRRRRRWRSEVTLLSTDRPEPPQAMASVIARDQIERGLSRLPLEQRTVLVLRFYMDLSHEHVAEVLDVPVGTVKSRLHRAQQALRGALEADARVLTKGSPSRARR